MAAAKAQAAAKAAAAGAKAAKRAEDHASNLAAVARRLADVQKSSEG